MEKITKFSSPTTVLPIHDVDTDQIVPARFLTATTREGIGEALFADWRYDDVGDHLPDFPLNHPEARNRKILVAGRNFGCGSSREHAPWAIHDFGIRAVISSDFADIFKNNSLKNGLLPIVVDEEIHEYLLERPGEQITVDLVECVIHLPDGRKVEFPIDAFARHCILEGIDQTGYLIQQQDNISAFEKSRSWQP